MEYSLFTRGNERLIVRGDESHVQITVEQARQMAEQGWKWSGHTHLGVDEMRLTPSDGDLKILKAFNQKQSNIYNQRGEYYVFKEKSK